MSVFEGIEPEVVIAEDKAAERDAAAAFIRRALDENVAPREIAIFVRSAEQLTRENHRRGGRAAVQNGDDRQAGRGQGARRHHASREGTGVPCHRRRRL